MDCFLKSKLWMMGIAGLAFSLPLWAKPLISVSQLTLSAQDQQALRSAIPQDTTSIATWVWQGDPLSLALPLNQEYRLIFPEPVQVDVNGQLTTDQIRIINDHQTVYVTALKSFKTKTRFYITLKNTNQIIFLDVSTPNKNQRDAIFSAKTIHIQLAPNLKSAHRTPSDSQSISLLNISPNNPENSISSEDAFFSASADDFVQASRFAWRQLYAPTYTLSDDTGFMRSPMHTQFWISGLLYSDHVFAHPIASWAGNNLFVTAVELRNPYSQATTLDISHDLCGRWQAAMLYPRTQLQAMGHKPNDSTTLFLISSEPFDQVFSAGGCDHGRA